MEERMIADFMLIHVMIIGTLGRLFNFLVIMVLEAILKI